MAVVFPHFRGVFEPNRKTDLAIRLKAIIAI
jgi:hypothetical protein